MLKYLYIALMPFKCAFGCFKGVLVYLSCICFFGAIWLFQDLSGLFCLWLPGNPGVQSVWARLFVVVVVMVHRD